MPNAGIVRSYYPDVKRETRKWEAFFEGVFRTWVNALDLTKLTAAQRQTRPC